MDRGCSKTKHQKGVYYKSLNGNEIYSIKLGDLVFPLRQGLVNDYIYEFRRWKLQRLGRQYVTINIGKC